MKEFVSFKSEPRGSFKRGYGFDFYSFNEKIFAFLLATIAFVFHKPYFLWYQPLLINRCLFIGLVFVAFFHFVGAKVNCKFFWPSLLFFFSWLIRQFYTGGIQPWYSSEIIMIVIFFLAGKPIQKESFRKFLDIYSLVMIPSIIFYILILLGVDLPWSYLESLNPMKTQLGYYYREYWGMVILSNQIFAFGDGEIFRLSGVFDEPGVVGTLSAILLVATDFPIRESRGKILLISGILSFSLAFYVICGIYFVLKDIKNFLFIILLFVSSFSILTESFGENEIVKRYLIDRFMKVYDGLGVLNNRESDDFKKLYDQFWDSEDLLWGRGNENALRDQGGSASYKVTVYTYGIVGFASIILYHLMFVVCSINRLFDLKLLLPYLACVGASLLQRPSFDSIGFVVVGFGGLTWILVSSKKNCDLNRRAITR